MDCAQRGRWNMGMTGLFWIMLSMVDGIQVCGG